MKNINTNPQDSKNQNSQFFLTVAAVLLIAIIAISFAVARFNGKSSQVTQEVIENLIAENENNPEAVKYLITDNCISRVYPETEVEAFVTNFSEGEEVKVYSDKECTEEVTDGFVVSGMYAKYEENGRVFEISVLGDIDEKTSKTEGGAVLVGDGVLNQIELTRDIRSCVDEEWKIDEEVEKKSGDVNCSNQIDELSVKTIIDYLVYGDLNVEEVSTIAKPTIEVVSGELNENTVYTSNVKIRITENEEDALKTVYKISGDMEQEYKVAVNGEEINLTENGIYKITAYTYGKLENKSKREYVIISIDKTANYTMEYYLEGENGEYSKVEDSTKVVEGEIGQTVEIEQKEFTDYELDVDNVSGKLQGAVLEDESLVLKAYYNRKSFTYTFEAGENIAGVTAEVVKPGEETVPVEPTKTVSVTAKWGDKINVNAIVANEPGYTITWKEWTNADDLTDKIEEQQMQITVGKENKTYKPSATKNVIDYTIVYELNNGVLPTGVTNPIKYSVETESFILNNPSKSGYEFKGWIGGTVNAKGEIDGSISAGNTSNVSVPTKTLTVNSGSLENRKYIANWEAITNTPYTVEHYKETLKTGEFTLAETENKGGTTDTIATATPKDYEGFEFDEENTNTVISGTVTDDGKLVLKLYYARKTYDLTIVAGNNIANISAQGETIEVGGEGNSTVGKKQTSNTITLKYKYEQKVDLAASRENKAGYNYENITWESSDSEKIATTTELTNAETATKQITMLAKNLEITAKVEKTPIVYNITYNLNGGALPQGESNAVTYTVEDENIEIKNLKDGTKLGYNFAGWTGSNGTVPSKNVVIAHGSTGDKTFTANWTEANFDYTVEYYYEGTDGYEIDASLTESHTAKFNAQISEFTDNSKVGYELKEQPTAITITYTESQNILKVYYNKKQHTLTLLKDDNTVASVTGFGTYKFGSQVEISAVLKEIDGYEITWNKWTSQTTGVSNNNNQTTTITMPDADVTLKAEGTKTPIVYGISYMLNGGEVATENPLTYTIESNDIVLTNPTKQGYVFAGWTGGTEKLNPGTTGNVDEPQTVLSIQKGSMGTRLYTANWVGDVKTEYTVEHYKENLDGTYAVEPSDIDVKEGTTDQEARANEKAYEGFEVDEENTNNVKNGIVKPDGSLVLKVYYKRKISTIGFVAGNNIQKIGYTVKDNVGAVGETSLTAEGTNLQGQFKYGTQINITATIEEEAGHTTTWSSWESSATDKIVNQATKESLIGVPVGDVTLTAKATRTTNKYGYKIEYYYDNVIDEEKTVETESTYGSKISSYTNKNITGFELDREENKPLTITENEDTNVMKVYYKHINYTITYDLNGGEMPLVDDEEPEGERQENLETYNVITPTFTLTAPEKTGYNFLGWTGTNGTEPSNEITIEQGSTGNREYKANWRAKSDTKYTIEHYKEGLDGEYVKVDSEELYGTTGTEVTTEGKMKTYTGFSYDASNANAVESGIIAGDESLVLKLYYNRNEYTLNLVAGDNIESVKYTITNAHGIAEGYSLTQSGENIQAKFKYGAGLSIQATLKEDANYNITNGKWTSSSTKVNPTSVIAEISMPDEDVTLTANATKTGKSYTYYTKYYYEDELEYTSSKTATYNTQLTTYTPRTKIGYKLSKVVGTPLTITENEETNVISVYYVLENYSIDYELDGGEMPLVDDEESERQENPTEYTVITPTFNLINPEKEGYVFTGWTGTDISTAKETVTIEQGSTGDREYTANWRASTETQYKIEHYIENLDSTEDETSEEIDESNYTKYTVNGLQETYIGTTGETVTATPIEIPGFTYNEGKSKKTVNGTVLANGSLVLKVFYTRNNYKLKLVVGDDNISKVSNGGDVSSTEIEKSYKYGSKVSIGASTATITGYIPRFDKWVSNNSALLSNQKDRITTITMPAGDIILTATGAREKAKYTYTVEYYYENLEQQMVIDEEKTVTGDLVEFESQVVSYAEKLEQGYELDRVDTLPLVISATPENNVIRVFYKLKNYSLLYDLQGGSLEEETTNPATYTVKTGEFTLNNPEKEGYIFLGWTGGVVNADGELDGECEYGTTPAVTNPTKTLTINKGSLGNRKYTANWQERSYEVIVHHYLAGTGPEYETSPVQVTEDEIFSSETLGAEYSVYDLIPTYDEQGQITNSDASERNYLDGKELYITGDSGNTTGVYTKDPIEVTFYYQYYPSVKIVSSPAESLNGTQYVTIKEALDALTNAGQTVNSDVSKLQVIRNIKDETVVINNLNIELDLNDYTVNSNAEAPESGAQFGEGSSVAKAEPAFKLTESKLTLLDESEYSRGKITSQNGSGVYVDTLSTFTLGIEERPIERFPEIIAKTYGVEKQIIGDGENKQEGTFNFFDGKITAQNAVFGTTDLTPLLYSATTTLNEAGDQVSTLGIITGKEARIGRQTYGLLEDAIEAASIEGEQVEIVLLKDITKDQRIVVPENKNIKLDLDGYSITTGIADYVLENRGKLEIVDSSATDENVYGNGKITSTTYSTILNSVVAGSDSTEYSYESLTTNPVNGFTVNEEGKIVSNNQGASSTTAHGYLIIDLTDESFGTDAYVLDVNAEVSSESNYDFGYATITNNATEPEYNNGSGRFVYISGTQQAADYTTILYGGKKYYLHLGYRKNGSGNKGTDTFTINSIKLGDAAVGELTITNGRVQIECAGSSSQYKQAIKNEGNLHIGSSDVNFTYIPYLYSSKSYTEIVNGKGNVTVNNAYMDAYASGIQASGNIIVNDGSFKSKDITLGHNSDSISGTTFTINGGTITKNVYNWSPEKLIINGGTLSNYLYLDNESNPELIVNGGKIDYISCTKPAKTTVNNGEIRTIYTDGELVLNDGTFNSITNKGGITTVNGGTIKSYIDNGSSGETITITDGTVGYIRNPYDGTVNIINGNIGYINNATYSSKMKGIVNIYDGVISYNGNAIVNQGQGTVNIYGGTIECTSTSKNTIKNDQEGILNIYGGTISNISKYACVYNNTGTLNIGNKDDETVGANNPIILGTKGSGAYNENGTMNYYDGIIKGKLEQSIFGTINEIPDGVVVLISYEGDNNEIEVSTLGIPQRPVAQIGETTYTTLQSAIDACPDNIETTIKMIDTENLLRGTTVSENKKIILDLNSNIISSLADTPGITNEGNMKIVDNTVVEQEIDFTTKVDSTLGFDIVDGKLVSTNHQGGTTANTYLPIDLTEYAGQNVAVTVNANVSSVSNSRYAYATIRENTTVPTYSSSTGRFIYITGEEFDNDYRTVLEGGKVYYLHLGYYKYSGSYDDSDVADEFTINKISYMTVPGMLQAKGGNIIQNNGTMEIGKICIEKTNSNGIVISNNNTLEVDGTIINSDANSDNVIIDNEEGANLTINNGRFIGGDDNTAVIRNKSANEVLIKNSYITGKTGVLNDNGGNVKLKDSSITATYSYSNGTNAAIRNNNGNVTIEGGYYKAESSTYNKIIYSKTGNILVKDGIFKTANNAFYLDGDTTLTINNFKAINCENMVNLYKANSEVYIENGLAKQCDTIIYNPAGGTKTVITGGTYNTSSYSIYNSSGNSMVTISNANFTSSGGYAVYNNSSSTVSLLSGSYTSTYKNDTYKGSGVYNAGTLILGEDDGVADKLAPSISGISYGVYNSGSSATCYFYDGVLEGKDGQAFYGNMIQAEDYNIVKETVTKQINGVDSVRQIAYLDSLDVAKVGTETFKNIKSAIEYCEDNEHETIELLRDVTIGGTDATLQIPENKDITLDLNGLKILASNNTTFENSGKFEVIDSGRISLEDNETVIKGEIRNTVGCLFKNIDNGDLTLTDCSIVTTAETYMIDNKSADCYPLRNEGSGKITVNGAVVTGERCILNTANGEILILSGSVTADRTHKCIYATGENGKVTISGGNIYGNEGVGATNGTVTISGGTVEGSAYGANMEENSKLVISGGTLNGDRESIFLQDDSELLMSDGTVKDGIRMYNRSKAKITGGIITDSSDNIELNGSTSIEITGGTFEATGYNIYCDLMSQSTDIVNKISGGTFITTGNTSIYNSDYYYTSSFQISGGTFAAKLTENSDATIVNTGNMVITNASVDGYNGIINRNKGKLTLGENDGTVDNNSIKVNAQNIGVQTLGKEDEFKYYDGTITAKEVVSGVITDIPDGHRITTTTNDDLLASTIIPFDNIAKIEGKGTYTTLQDAITAAGTDVTTIEIMKSFMPSTIELNQIANNQNITIDLNGYTIENNGNMFVNEGTLKIIDSSVEGTGIIKGYSKNLINNTGSLELNCNIEQTRSNMIINNSGTGSVVIHNGNIKAVDNRYYTSTIINTSSSGNIEIEDGNFVVETLYAGSKEGNNAYFINNTGSGDITISGGEIEAYTASQVSCYGIYSNNSDSDNISKITISGGNMTYERDYEFYAVYTENNTDIEITGGTIYCTYGIRNKGGYLKINGDNVEIDANYYAVSNEQKGTTDIIKGKLNSRESSIKGWDEAVYNSGTLNISGGEITAGDRGVYNYAYGTVIITGGSISGKNYGFYNWGGQATFTGGEISATKENDESIYAVYLTYDGTFTMGVKDYPVSRTNPKVTSTSYGVYRDSGTFNFYDGILIGNTKALSGEVADVPELYSVFVSDSGKQATLEIKTEFEQVAVMGNMSYDSVQAAISSAGETANVIVLQKDVILTQKLVIGANQNITLDLQGHSITIPDGDYAILNNGNLTIIDTVLTDLTITVRSIIENRAVSEDAGVGAGIYNAAGATLTLGIEDDVMYQYAPTIVGNQTSIENYGTFNMFDGTLKAKNTTIGGTVTVFSVPDGYSYEEKTVDNLKELILKVAR